MSETDWLLTYLTFQHVITYAGTSYEIVRVDRDGDGDPVLVVRELGQPNGIEQWMPPSVLAQTIQKRLVDRVAAKEMIESMRKPP